MGSFKKALDISGNRVCGCDDRGVHGVDIATGDRPLGMTQQRRDSGFSEAKIIRDAGETMSQHMRCDVVQTASAEYLRPVIGKSAEGVVAACAGEHISSSL